jgi:hypothetical protein
VIKQLRIKERKDNKVVTEPVKIEIRNLFDVNVQLNYQTKQVSLIAIGV